MDIFTYDTPTAPYKFGNLWNLLVSQWKDDSNDNFVDRKKMNGSIFNMHFGLTSCSRILLGSSFDELANCSK